MYSICVCFKVQIGVSQVKGGKIHAEVLTEALIIFISPPKLAKIKMVGKHW